MNIKRMVHAATKEPVVGTGALRRPDRQERDVVSRRALISLATATLAGVHLPALSLVIGPDVELLALGEPYEHTLAAIETLGSTYARAEERFFALRNSSDLDEDVLRTITGVDCAEDAYHRALACTDLVIDRIVDRPARTIRGLAFKAMVSLQQCHGRTDLIDGIVADLIAMGSLEA